MLIANRKDLQDLKETGIPIGRAFSPDSVVKADDLAQLIG
jgi:hypothetical protein